MVRILEDLTGIVMLSLKPVINRLTPKPAGFEPLWFRKVAGAAEYAQAQKEGLPLPMCWVIRMDDKADAIGIGEADVTIGFEVVMAIENLRSHEVGDTDDLLLGYRKAVNALLLGWQLEADGYTIRFKGGRVIDYTDGDLFWRDSYAVDTTVSNYLPDPPVYSSLEKIYD